MSVEVKIYDTTLRDGTQGESVSLSVDDKLAIARMLGDLGVHYVEGGWPGSNVKDAEFFRRAKSLNFGMAKLAAFGSTCHWRNSPETDPNLKALLDAETPVVTIFGKTWDLHVTKALGTTLDRNLELIEASVDYLKRHGREVVYDAEHFFDGFRANPDYSLKTLQAAERGGADWLVLCDTNGGMLTRRLREIVLTAKEAVGLSLGIHAHNDSDLAVANSLAAVESGATQIQGTINGYGERCGNANLCSLIPILELKLGRATIGQDALARLTMVSRCVSEIANLPHRSDMPFVGTSAFAHKGGVHVSAVMRDPVTYEHVSPDLTGNSRRVLVSDLSGKSNIAYKAAEMGVDLTGSDDKLKQLVDSIKQMEHEGFQFEAADGSLRVMFEEALGRGHDTFSLERYSVVTERDSSGHVDARAEVTVVANGEVIRGRASGNGPVHALDLGLRQALSGVFPHLDSVRLADYKVRILESDRGTATRVRVLIETQDAESTWTTVGVSDNILDASCNALVDAFKYKLLKSADTAGSHYEVLHAGVV
ncbi:MAG TPA: citramalate synthase [Blastocatellia bacterium]